MGELVKQILVILFVTVQFSWPAFAGSTPTSDFTDNKDGTVTHNTTGLTWKRCAEGQTWTGATCSNNPSFYDWSQAISLGTNGWGLPTKDQLLSIVETSQVAPSINETIFPNSKSGWFWSATEDAQNSVGAWYVNFNRGLAYDGSKSNTYYVRLVRGGKTTTPITTTPTSSSCQNLSHIQTVNLINSLANTGYGESMDISTPWSNLSQFVNGLDVSTNYDSCSACSQMLAYWVSQDSTYFRSQCLGVTLGSYGIQYYYLISKTSSLLSSVNTSISTSVNSSSTALTLSGLSIKCPTSIKASASDSCSATANYSDGTSKSVNVTWSSSNSTVLAASSSGNLTAGSPTANTPVTISASYSENSVNKLATSVVTVNASATSAVNYPANPEVGVTPASNALGSRSNYLPIISAVDGSLNPSFFLINSPFDFGKVANVYFVIKQNYSDNTSDTFFVGSNGVMSRSAIPLKVNRALVKRTNVAVSITLSDVVNYAGSNKSIVGYEVYGAYQISGDVNNWSVGGYKIKYLPTTIGTASILSDETKVKSAMSAAQLVFSDNKISDLWPVFSRFVEDPIDPSVKANVKLSFIAWFEDKLKQVACGQALGDVPEVLQIITSDERDFMLQACSFYSDLGNLLVSPADKSKAIDNLGRAYAKTRLGKELGSQCAIMFPTVATAVCNFGNQQLDAGANAAGATVSVIFTYLLNGISILNPQDGEHTAGSAFSWLMNGGG